MKIVNRENGELIFDSLLTGAGTLNIPESSGVFVMTDEFVEENSGADGVVQVHKLDRKTFLQLGHFWGAYFEVFVGELTKNDIVEAPIEVQAMCESLRKNSAELEEKKQELICIGHDAAVTAVLGILGDLYAKFESASGAMERAEISEAIEKIRSFECHPG